MPDMYGSTTFSAAATATAASTAFPPSSSMRSPATAASGWAAATTPLGATTGGRVELTASSSGAGAPLILPNARARGGSRVGSTYPPSPPGRQYGAAQSAARRSNCTAKAAPRNAVITVTTSPTSCGAPSATSTHAPSSAPAIPAATSPSGPKPTPRQQPTSHPASPPSANQATIPT